MEVQYRPYSSTQEREVPLRLFVGVIYLSIGLILYLFTN